MILRALPLLLALSLVIAVRYSVLGDQPAQVWHSIMLILVPVGYALLICYAAKWFGVGFARQLSADADGSKDSVEPTTAPSAEAAGGGVIDRSI